MKRLTMTVAVAIAATAVLAYPGARHQLWPAPAGAPTQAPAQAACGEQSPERADPPAVRGISWFQGTLEEAFVQRTHHGHGRALLHF